MTTDQWYVLIEEDTRTTRNADGAELRLHRWTLAASHPVINGTEAQALATAEDAALHYLPAILARHARPGTPRPVKPSSPQTAHGWCTSSSVTASATYA
ncbi:hypothetical protein WKI68_44430 [Streptomyces sp. MS1.HAVA.3]|uniref:Uncharacterized protein n=1 Tax=Streptomyces caledonius TaxID=3134107 RepID=A0ABU8UEU8_9ACTN